MAEGKCPIWGTPAEVLPTTRDGQDVDSPRAGGRYFISGTAAAILGHRADHVRKCLTTWLVDQRWLGVECPEISSTTIEIVGRYRPLGVLDRVDRVLKFLETRSEYIGAPIDTEVSNAAEKLYGPGHTDVGAMLMAVSESVKSKEVDFLIKQLVERGFLEVWSKSLSSASHVISVEGYTYLAEIENKAVDSQQAFVAMWFDESMKAAYELGIAPAILDTGYEPLRIDRKEHNNKIDDLIISEINRSRFVVADFTHGDSGARGGVYYEAGFAHGLNIPVIFTCREDAIDKVHFDTRQYNHITWKTPEDLRVRLAQRISATIGDGPLRSSG